MSDEIERTTNPETKVNGTLEEEERDDIINFNIKLPDGKTLKIQVWSCFFVVTSSTSF